MKAAAVVSAIFAITSLSGCLPPGWQGESAAAAQSKGASQQLDLVDFVDHTPRYKGQIITMDLVAKWNGGGEYLNERKGTRADFQNFDPGFFISIEIPRDIEVPRIAWSYHAKVTFLCGSGDLKTGNVAQRIERP